MTGTSKAMANQMASQAKILDGRALANQFKRKMLADITALMQIKQRPPGLAVIVVGDNPSSLIYVAHKQRACAEVGIVSHLHALPQSCSQNELLILIKELNSDATVDGILVQLPLPDAISTDAIVEAIHPDKDVDGFHPYNLGRLTQRRPTLRPCTPYGIMQLLAHYEIDVLGKHAVIVGASNLVGRPMALELLLVGATVTVCHRFTTNLQHHVQQADMLIVATGRKGLIQADWVPKHAIVIDVGIHRNDDGSVSGDLDYTTLSQKVAWITPVPGGVGPMTVAMLLANTLQAYRQTVSLGDSSLHSE